MRTLLWVVAALVAGCQAPLVSPYDEAIDKGIVEFYEQLNYFVRDVADLAGKPEGTYEANAGRYNVMETKLDVLILGQQKILEALVALGTDPVRLRAMTEQLSASAQALKTAVQANQPKGA